VVAVHRRSSIVLLALPAVGAALALLAGCWFDSPSMCLSQSGWAVPNEGGTSPPVTVENCGGGDYLHWELEKDNDWVSLSRTSGNTPGSFTITASPNMTGAWRTATITVRARGAHGAPMTFSVTQGSRLFSGPRSYDIGGFGNSISAARLQSGADRNIIVGDSQLYLLRYDWRYGILAEPDVYAVDGFPTLSTAADLNGDGFEDIVLGIVRYNYSKVCVLLNSGFGTFPHTLSYDITYRSLPGSAAQVVTGDFNGDGMIDVAVSHYGCGFVAVLTNRGNGSLGTPVGYTAGPGTMGLIARDFDGDGDLDIAVAANAAAAVDVLLNDGTGTFGWPVAYPAGMHPTALVAADLNQDGVEDLVASDAGSHTVATLFGRGGGSFGPARLYEVGEHPVSITAADFNADWYPDIAVANQGSGTLTILLNDGAGVLAPEGTYAVGGPPTSLAAVDLDLDGAPDLVVGSPGKISIFKNLHW
jgi:hypothetical protein